MKTRWRIIFGIVTLAIVVYLLRKIDFVEVWALIVQADNFYFLLAFLAYLLGFLIFNIRSMYFVKSVVKPDYWFSFETMLAGFFVNTITPGAQIGGDPIRAHFLGKKYDKPKTKIFGALLADRFFHVVVSLFFIIASALFILTYVPVSPELRTIFQAVLFVALLLLLGFGYFSFRKTNFNIELFLKKFRWLYPQKEKIKDGQSTKLEKILIKHFGHFAKTFRKIVRTKKMIFIGVVLSLAYWLLNFATSYFLFLAFGVEISFLIVIVVFSIGNLIGDLSPSPGGMGLIEGVSIITYSLLGVGLSVAVAVALLTRIIFYLFSLLLGGISLAHLEKTV